MKENLKGIILGSVRHSDKHNVTNVFTRERGRMAFVTPVGASKKGRQSASRIKPLSVVELQANISPTKELHIPSSISQAIVWRTIYFDPYKSTIALFLSEFLLHLLRDAPPEPRLWDFIVDSLRIFDATTEPRSIANFHIAFLINLMPIMGIQPDTGDYAEGMEFDMKAGVMLTPFSMQSSRGTRIEASKTALIPKLIRMNYANSRYFKFRGSDRSELIDYILRYYGCHFPGSNNLKSLDIIREIYS